MLKLFISYTKADQVFVNKLAKDLTRAGVEVWVSAWEIKVGDSIIDKIQNALSSNNYLVLVLSPEAMNSNWVKRELNTSLMRSLSDNNVKIFPVLHKPCSIPPIIVDLKYADFTSDYKKGFLELSVGLEIMNPVPGHILQPKSIIDTDTKIIRSDYSVLCPFTFADFPECLFAGGTLDAAIIIGSTEREHAGETDIFNHTSVKIDIFDTKWEFFRQVSPGTVRDSVRVADLAAFIGFSFGKYSTTNTISWPQEIDSICTMDVSVTSEMLERNLILVGGADTNIYIPIATIAFRQKYGYSLPIRYFGDDQLYFTCDQIYSELSGKSYSRLEDLSYMHCGYLLMVANPWAFGKVIIFVVGTRATGTQAALLALIRGRDSLSKEGDWHSLKFNNKHLPEVPGKIVRATKAFIVDGNNYIHDSKEITVPDKARISQRHSIVDFEFLE